jgi:nucleoside-diphosphate-sugar epimerase
MILVTGGTGLLGKRFVSRLIQLGHNVRMLSRRPPSGDAGGSVQVVSGDIRDVKLVEEAVSGCDAVFHCTAETKDATAMREVNVIGTRNVYEAAHKNRVRYFCHLSSVGVVGKTDQRVVDEDTPCCPTNLYEQTKLEAEQIVAQGIEGGGVTILRPTNVFAEETFDVDSYRGFRRAVRVWLTGKEISHLVYADDVAAAGIYLLENAAPAGCKKFIVSSDEEPGGSNAEVYSLARSFLGYKIKKARHACPIELAYALRILRHGHGNRGDVRYSARRLLSTGFKMPFGLIEGIRRSVEYSQRRLNME